LYGKTVLENYTKLKQVYKQSFNM